MTLAASCRHNAAAAAAVVVVCDGVTLYEHLFYTRHIEPNTLQSSLATLSMVAMFIVPRNDSVRVHKNTIAG